jgi:transposase-like protein
MNTDQATASGRAPEGATDKRRRLTRYTTQERERLLREYAASGETRQDFCAKRGIITTTFHGWFKRARKVPSPSLVEVTLPPVPKATPPIAIRYPNGVVVEIHFHGAHDALIAFIRGVAGC